MSHSLRSILTRPPPPPELPPAAMWRNLWRTNNLEQFRAHEQTSGGAEEAKSDEVEGAEGAAAAGQGEGETGAVDMSRFPKVLITIRSEHLSGKASYASHFVPVEVSWGVVGGENAEGKRFL